MPVMYLADGDQFLGQARRTAAFRWLRDDARFAGGILASGLRRYELRRAGGYATGPISAPASSA
jgi:hypothetical protein